MTRPYDPNDPEREGNLLRHEDGSPIENSTPEALEQERLRSGQKKSEQKTR